MAWTAPRTWSTGETVTAAHMNAHVRDNLLETAPAKATTDGGIFVATGANALAERVFAHQVGDGTYTGTGTGDNTYFALNGTQWGSGSNISVTATTGTRALLMYGCATSIGSARELSLSYDVTSATTIGESDIWRVVVYGGYGGSRAHLQTSLNAGSNNFRIKAKSDDISLTSIIRPWLFVLPL